MAFRAEFELSARQRSQASAQCQPGRYFRTVVFDDDDDELFSPEDLRLVLRVIVKDLGLWESANAEPNNWVNPLIHTETRKDAREMIRYDLVELFGAFIRPSHKDKLCICMWVRRPSPRALHKALVPHRVRLLLGPSAEGDDGSRCRGDSPPFSQLVERGDGRAPAASAAVDDPEITDLDWLDDPTASFASVPLILALMLGCWLKYASIALMGRWTPSLVMISLKWLGMAAMVLRRHDALGRELLDESTN
ncbi:hypothetical protein T492DRAFT_844227 [Pavlovales sp. CCMP2436]|nr:hypothetical protein T492DRAFT_844227 [Pavlovales sp. CCMP2436]